MEISFCYIPEIIARIFNQQGGVGGRGVVSKISLRNRWRGILLTLRTVARGGRRAKFWPKTTLHNVWMIPYEKSLPEVIDLGIFGRRYFGLHYKNIKKSIKSDKKWRKTIDKRAFSNHQVEPLLLKVDKKLLNPMIKSQKDLELMDFSILWHHKNPGSVESCHGKYG